MVAVVAVLAVLAVVAVVAATPQLMTLELMTPRPCDPYDPVTIVCRLPSSDPCDLQSILGFLQLASLDGQVPASRQRKIQHYNH